MTDTSNLARRPLHQEGLKLLACITMLTDHIGATLVLRQYYLAAAAGMDTGSILELYNFLRSVGRLAFPIYCFLLCEGVCHTRHPGKYALRLLAAALLSEVPYDLALHGGFSWEHQSVMITLLLGFGALQLMKRTEHMLLKLLCAAPFALAAEWLHTDYGADGIWVIVLFALTRQWRFRELWQFLGLWLIFSADHLLFIGWFRRGAVAIQELACLAAVPIALYSGEKKSGSRALQWGFYLFYPVHLTVLWLMGVVL